MHESVRPNFLASLYWTKSVAHAILRFCCKRIALRGDSSDMRIKAKPRKKLTGNVRRTLSARDPGLWLAMGTLAVTTVTGRSQYALAEPVPGANSRASVKAAKQVR